MVPTKEPKKGKDYRFNLEKLAQETANSLKPQRIGAIPKLAVLLGLLSPQFYEIYELCDGNRDINSIATELKQEPMQMRIAIDKLIKSKMVQVQ